jgi:hypothetical protein
MMTALSSMVIVDRGILAIAGELFRTAFPNAVRGWFLGPRNLLSLSATDTEFRRPRRRFRPTDVVVAEDMILRKVLTIPVKARSDLRAAIELLLRSQTPFETREILVGAQARRKEEGLETFDVLIVPRLAVADALRRHRVRRIGRIGLDHPRGQAIDLTPALSPMRRWTRLLWLLPLAIGFAAFYTSLAVQAEANALRSAEVETLLGRGLAALKSASVELDGLKSQSARSELVLDSLRSTPSTVATLSTVRSVLDPNTEVVRIELREGVYRLAVKAVDALREAKRLAEAMPGWSIALDGAITNDPVTGLESAMIQFGREAIP